MPSSATGVGMPICLLGGVLLILTQKNSQKFGDVLGIMSRGAEKKVAKNRFFLICDACRITKDSPIQKDCPLFINRFFLFLGR